MPPEDEKCASCVRRSENRLAHSNESFTSRTVPRPKFRDLHHVRNGFSGLAAL